MYGAGFGPEGLDSCTPASGTDPSFVYRIDMRTKAIDQVIPVGAVPKYVAVTPDDKTVLVTNWCSWDLSVIDVATHRVTSHRSRWTAIRAGSRSPRTAPRRTSP